MCVHFSTNCEKFSNQEIDQKILVLILQIFISFTVGPHVASLLFDKIKGCSCKQERHDPCTQVPYHFLLKTDTSNYRCTEDWDAEVQDVLQGYN